MVSGGLVVISGDLWFSHTGINISYTLTLTEDARKGLGVLFSMRNEAWCSVNELWFLPRCLLVTGGTKPGVV